MIEHTLPGPTDAQNVSEIELEDLATGSVIVDVRAPREFAEDHIPGSVNVPLLGDRERAVIGTIYRHQGAPAARNWGFDRVRERLEAYTLELFQALDVGEPGMLRVIVCARGGQRSEAVTRHLRTRGQDVVRLRGGYRAYRESVRDRLARSRVPGPVVLNGLTGSGKTLVLRRIARRYPTRVVDLEGLAAHRSSLFGDIGLSPVSQKSFESGLVASLDLLSGPWSLFEWEARRIGDRELPAELYHELCRAPQIELRASVEQRVDVLCDEYLRHGMAEPLRERLPALARYDAFGTEGVARLDELLARGEYRRAAAELLEKHYDPRYRHGSEGRTVVERFEVTTVDETSDRIIDYLESCG